MTSPELHLNTAELHQMVPFTTRPRSHADLIRTFNAGLAELTADGVLTPQGKHAWLANGVLVAKFGTYIDGQGREQTCLYFGSWLSLAMALKVSHKETRKALMTNLRHHPIY